MLFSLVLDSGMYKSLSPAPYPPYIMSVIEEFGGIRFFQRSFNTLQSHSFFLSIEHIKCGMWSVDLSGSAY